MGKLVGSRRKFLKDSSLAVAMTGLTEGLSIARAAYTAGSDEIKLALIGCGGRGTGAAIQALKNASHPNVKLVALADAFPEPVERCLQAVRAHCGGKVDVPGERQFIGLDCHRGAIDSGADMVLLCSPPGFRPCQFEAAVAAGKHVFMEKPLATDAPGVRRIMAANDQAKQKGLLVAVGHHLRHDAKYCEIIPRIHEGILGQLQFLRAYFNSSGVWVRPRKPEQTEMQYQVNNWYYFTWLSGDHIAEQHVHDIDVCNWIMKDQHPVEANGMGGRQVRIGKEFGEIFDHHAVEFSYQNGTKMFSFCRHIPGCWNSFSEHAHGTKGYANIGRGTIHVAGQEPMHFQGGPDGHQLEHDHLFAALGTGELYNECDWAVQSTMTAIMGRMASYSGKIVSWDEAINSELDLTPKQFLWDAEAPVRPGADGLYASAMPGMTKAW